MNFRAFTVVWGNDSIIKQSCRILRLFSYLNGGINTVPIVLPPNFKHPQYVRFLLNQYVDKGDCVVYLDVDMVPYGNVISTFNSNLGLVVDVNTPIIYLTDPEMDSIIRSPIPYFNTGFFISKNVGSVNYLFDKTYRARDTEVSPYKDQSTLNHFIREESYPVQILPPIYNFLANIGLKNKPNDVLLWHFAGVPNSVRDKMLDELLTAQEIKLGFKPIDDVRFEYTIPREDFNG